MLRRVDVPTDSAFQVHDFRATQPDDVEICPDGTPIVLIPGSGVPPGNRLMHVDHLGTWEEVADFGVSRVVDFEIDRDGSLVVAGALAPRGFDGIVRVDPATGARTVLVERSGGTAVHNYLLDVEIADDGSLFCLFAMPAGDEIIRVDPAGGETAVAHFAASTVEDMEIGPDGTVLVGGALGEWGHDGIVRVDPATGTRTLLVTLGGGTAVHNDLVDVEVDENGGVFAQMVGAYDFPLADRIVLVDTAGTSTVVFRASGGHTNDIAIWPSDTDGDALLDHWETHGLDVNLDGVIDLDLPALGADPLHKDLFVEVDAMTEDLNGNGSLDPGEDLPDGALQFAEDVNGNGDLDPGEDVPNGLLDRMAPWVRDPATGAILSNNLDDVVAAFAAAPNGLVQNPDGLDGVDLHVLADEDDIPVEPFPNGFRDFNPVKADHYGTRAERADPNWDNIRAARQMVYRYCIFAGTHSGTTSGGLAEVPGDDFMVTLWGWDPPGGDPDEQCGIFMHELGHTLGLRHGGADNINYKPNYHSVMNYYWSEPDLLNSASWELDYSRVEAATLDETDLDESVGCGFPAGTGHDMHARWIWTGPGAGQYVPEVGPVDWSGDDRDGDGVADNDRGVRADVNLDDHNQDGNIDAADATPGQALKGYEDWSNLRYGLYGHRNFADGDRDDSTIHAEYTYEFRLARERMMPKLVPGQIRGAKWHDMDGDGQWDPGEPGLGQWLIYVDANHNGRRDPDEIGTYTDGDGYYRLSGLDPGAYTVAEGMQPGWKQTAPGGDGTHAVLVLPGEIVDGVNFGNTRERIFDGTPGDDVFELYPDDALGGWVARLNGVPHELDATGCTLSFDGAGGRDFVRLTGTAGDDRLELWPDRGTLTGDGYLVTITNVESVRAYASEGSDVAHLHGDPNAPDTFVGKPDYGKLYNGQFCHVAFGFRYVHAYASGGGDVAAMYGDPTTRDTLVATPDYGKLSNGEFYHRAVGFRYVHAYASGDGDVAELYDDPATADMFKATPDWGKLYNTEFYNRAVGFRYVEAHASGGGDVAALYDDRNTKDTFVATPNEGRLHNNEFDNRAIGFRYVHAYASGGGDVARLYDDPATADTFKATPDWGRLYNTEFYHRAVGFRYVHAAASGGGDVARLYDDPTTQETFFANPDEGHLSNSEFFIHAISFPRVHAYSSGGDDTAKLFGDSSTQNTFVGRPDYSRLYNGQFHNLAVGFRYVHGYASGAGDVAYLYDDSTTQEAFVATPDYGVLSNSRFANYAFGFARVHAYASGGDDIARLYDDSNTQEIFVVRPDHSRLYNSRFHHLAVRFRYVHGYASGGGDLAYLYDSIGDDHLYAAEALAELTTPKLLAQAHDFARVRAVSFQGGSDTKREAATDYVLETIGPWMDVLAV